MAGAGYGEAGGAWGCWTIGIPREAPISRSAQQGAGAGVYSSYMVTVSPGNDPDGGIARLYGGPAPMPTTLILDKSGRIAVTHAGLCTRNEYDDAIKGLLNEH